LGNVGKRGCAFSWTRWSCGPYWPRFTAGAAAPGKIQYMEHKIKQTKYASRNACYFSAAVPNTTVHGWITQLSYNA